jgi:hypothetical protein
VARFYVLTTEEMAELFRQDPTTAKDGGFQNFIVRLQKQARRNTLEVKLDDDDIERIRKYAADARHGGWQQRILAIFGRVLSLDAPHADAAT